MGCTRRRSGTVNLFGRGRLDSRGWASNVGDLYRNGSAAANFRPHPKCLHPGSPVFGGSDVITTETEKVVDLIVSCDETLSLAGRFELLHLPLSCRVGWSEFSTKSKTSGIVSANIGRTGWRVLRSRSCRCMTLSFFSLPIADRSACERIRSDRTIAPEPVRGDFS